jgi:hypothetical protein
LAGLDAVDVLERLAALVACAMRRTITQYLTGASFHLRRLPQRLAFAT